MEKPSSPSSDSHTSSESEVNQPMRASNSGNQAAATVAPASGPPHLQPLAPAAPPPTNSVNMAQYPNQLPHIKNEPAEDVDLRNISSSPFINKMWNMINEPANHKYIRWSPDGKSILITDREGLERDLLPHYFKHKRFTSFVRQLNMYGWHKVQDINAGTMQSSEEHWQFTSPFFVRDHPELLSKIYRKRNPSAQQPPSTTVVSTDEGKEKNQNLKAIMKELENIRNRQINIGEDLSRVRKENEMLWSEYYQTRERYDKHSQMFSRILRFLATVYGNQYKLLDMNNADQISQNFIRQPEPYMQINPYNQPKSIAHNAAFDSGIRDLKEMEQMQSQIQAVNSPLGSPTTSSNSPVITPTEEVPRMSMPISQVPPNIPKPGNISNTATNRNANGNANINVNASANPASNTVNIPRANAPQRPSGQPQQVGPIPTQTQNGRNRKMPQAQAQAQPSIQPVDPVPVTERALTPIRELIPNRSRINSLDYTPFNIPGQPPSVGNMNNGLNGDQQRQPSQLIKAHTRLNQAKPNVNPYGIQYDEDPATLFPELGELEQQPGMPPLSSQDLEQISRELSSNGASLQSIQDWISRQSTEEPPNMPPVQPQSTNIEDTFNVDDFLANEEPRDLTDPGENSSPQLQEISEEPERKKMKVA